MTTNDKNHEETETESSEEKDYEDEEEGDDDEPVLKYSRLTESLGGIYRNGDATSTFAVVGDKMPLRIYHAHSASVTALSVSPFKPPTHDGAQDVVEPPTGVRSPAARGTESPGRGGRPVAVPPTRSNQIHIASASVDGNICVAALLDTKDVHIRNFGRPLQGIALSPQFKTDRTYLSAGLAGKLILTSGAKPGTSSAPGSTGTLGPPSGWLSSLGLASQDAKDVVLHSGEGAISTIKWSWTGRYVIWINEKGIKIMRSNIGLDSADSDLAWKRIGHIDRPSGPVWEDMASVWRSRVEWIDEEAWEFDQALTAGSKVVHPSKMVPVSAQHSSAAPTKSKKLEKVVIGWGGTVWIIHIHPGGAGHGKQVGERLVARAEIVTILIVLAYITEDSEAEEQGPGSASPVSPRFRRASSQASRDDSRKHRGSANKPELRLIDLTLPDEDAVVSADSLSVGRFQTLSPIDYHLGVTRVLPTSITRAAPKGRFEGIGGEILTAGLRVTKVLGSSTSVRSDDNATEAGSGPPGLRTSRSTEHSSGSQPNGHPVAPHSAAAGPGLKIYMHSPYDCILATRRDLHDRLEWLLEHEKYEEAWDLIESNPEVVSGVSFSDRASAPSTPTKAPSKNGHPPWEEGSVTPSLDVSYSAAEKEKRRIGEAWIKQRINSGDWAGAAAVCGKVLGTSTRWEHWVWVFAQAGRFEEITPFIPVKQLHPPLPSLVYEYVLGHYIAHDRLKLKELLDLWPPDLFEIKTITDALESKLRAGDVRADTAEGGETGRDWRILMEALAKLLVADSKPREALRCYMRLKDADAVMGLIQQYSLLDAIADDIPGFLQLRLTPSQMRTATIAEIEEATSEGISLLVRDAIEGIVRPTMVVKQLEDKDLLLLLFFYLRALWNVSTKSETGRPPSKVQAVEYSPLDEFGDVAVELFAEYDRALLLQFLQQSQSYTFDKACLVCERRSYIPELVYLLSKTGETKRALFLIIDKLGDVSHAISFAKAQDDPDLWDDLLNYSMNKPRFIRGLLEEVGTAVDPIQLVRRIPEGLEIEGLKRGLSKILKEYELQYSISEGVAKILRGEVALALETSRIGRVKGIKFDVGASPQKSVHQASDHRKESKITVTGEETANDSSSASDSCRRCGKGFLDAESETLVGFACGHVFHLACLLDEAGNELAHQTSIDSENVRNVGAKVTRAKILRDLIAGGCPATSHAEDQLETA
ncbi:MAG: hypothetical protein M1823_002277 [Watsoniomyces obsoletus]|nr:MAG: hypothetical protein M1823_002277 [Watsoniomyces obsoletus]